MKIIIAGGSGFLGQALDQYFTAQGHQVSILTRSPQQANHLPWDGKTLGPWVEHLNSTDLLINLSGKSVDCRYTASHRKAIFASRLESTAILQKALQACASPPKAWLNASSATTYVHAEVHKMTETEGIIGDDFSMRVCKEWEAGFFAEPLPHTRKIALRTSIVLGDEGGAFPKLRGLTRWGLGGRQGSGRQWVSWVHLRDFCRAVDFCCQNETLRGPVNITAPEPIRNRDFMAALRQRYRRPWGLSAPQPILEIGTWLLQTESELILKSRYVFPQRLQESGFVFTYPRLSDALTALA